MHSCLYCMGFPGQSNPEYKVSTREMGEDFENICIEDSDVGISFVLSDEEGCRVEFFEPENQKHSAVVDGETLVITTQESDQPVIISGGDMPSITVFLPGKGGHSGGPGL